MERVRHQIRLTEMIQKKWNGEGITIGILDTGICEHPDFGNRILMFRDFVKNKETCFSYDDSGHGTHVAGCLAGSGYLSHGKYAGIAPKANLVAAKVLDRHGDGSVGDMLNAIEWILENNIRYHIRIVNISVGVGKIEDKNLQDKMMQGIAKLWQHGIIVVAAAGNNGPAPMTISPIASSEYVITVGCHDREYRCNHLCEMYSGRGPTKANLKKPDIVAPGTDIVSCAVYDTRKRNRSFVPYAAKSGTSMATPLVAGACALLLQKNPKMTNAEVKRRLLISADDLKEPWSKQGWGMLNIERLLTME